MILYLDTSSLVKLYVEEVHAVTVRQDATLALFFSSFDEKLNKAAAAEGFQVLLPE